MKGLIYGAGHCWNGMVNMHLRKSSLEDCLSDDQFLSFLDHEDVPSDLTAQRRLPSLNVSLILHKLTTKFDDCIWSLSTCGGLGRFTNRRCDP